MDQRRPSRCSQRENALVARTPGSFGCGRDGADGCNSGADPESALGSFLRIHRPGPDFCRAHRHLRDGEDPRKNAVEQPKSVCHERFETIRGAVVTIVRHARPGSDTMVAWISMH